ncbi:hypothetical protein Tco_0288728, partial [Tanacetum coccineum]
VFTKQPFALGLATLCYKNMVSEGHRIFSKPLQLSQQISKAAVVGTVESIPVASNVPPAVLEAAEPAIGVTEPA